jgi:peptidoglycan/LPS O-acetylase OafA/YrhL
MLYHMSGQTDTGTQLDKLGIYGVCIFFILSGLSMAIAYDAALHGFRGAAEFVVRRLFRIWPSLWLVLVLVVIPAHFQGLHYSGWQIVLNLTMLFGFFAPTHYINMGAWSIGNEMVYYALTPVLIAAYHWHKAMGNFFTLISALIGLYFAFSVIDPNMHLRYQWAQYINPLNNLYFYCAGIAIYYNFRNAEIPASWRLALFTLAVLVFILFPTSGDQIGIVSGPQRVAFSCMAITLVFAFYQSAPALPKFLDAKLEWLGLISYGIYLLHPIALTWTKTALPWMGITNTTIIHSATIITTLAAASLTHHMIERPMMRLGKILIKSPEFDSLSPKLAENAHPGFDRTRG